MRKHWLLAVVVAVGRRPDLWLTALGQVRALAPARWWSRMPPSPAPASSWLAFRMETAYGDTAARPDGRDVVRFLEWCRETPLGQRPMG